MIKHPLIHFEGALFHITARGNDKRNIFLNFPIDCRRYLQNLQKCQKKLPFILYAFVLMPNHLHLLIEVKKHSIDKIMQVLQTGYTMYFNIKYKHVGHLFQGRYKSFLIDKESYLLEVIRYIHLNPVRAGLVKNPSEYPWSSHLSIADSRHEFSRVISRRNILGFFSENPRNQVKLYKEFVLSGIGNSWKDVFPAAAWGKIIGQAKFIHAVEEKLRKKLIKSRSIQQ